MIELDYLPGATPIDADEMGALIPEIHFQSELNQWERSNIEAAINWAKKSRTLRKNLVTLVGIKLLHEKMFSKVWQWAGNFRTTDKNIGVASYQLQEEVHKLCDDLRYQIDQGVENWDLLAVTFHHRLVLIHPFPNGNGRHARLWTDFLLMYNGQKALSWGYTEELSGEQIRNNYINALKAADIGDMSPLYLFATGEH